MIDANVPETGQQPRDLVVAIVADSFEHAMRLADPGAAIPQLQPAIDGARLAQEHDDLRGLDLCLRAITVAAIATRVRLACIEVPDPGGAAA